MTFVRPRTSHEIRDLCAAQDVPLYELSGGHVLCLGDPRQQVYYRPMSGRFWGRRNGFLLGIDSDSRLNDHEPWMQALRGFFHVHAVEPELTPEDHRRQWEHHEAERRGQIQLPL